MRSNGRKKVGSTDYGWILPVGVIGILGYLAYTYFGGNGSITDTGSNNSSIDTNSAATAAADLAKTQADGVTQILSDSTLNGIATTLFQLLGNDGDQSTIVNNVIQVNNAADWYRLVQLFGTKKFNSGGSFNSCALIGIGCDSYDLPGALRLVLDAQHLQDINSYFVDQGIGTTI